MKILPMQSVARTCGDCSLCCKVTAIKEINKPMGKWCEHCQPGKGCKIYATPERPPSCGEFSCLWLQGLLPESWSPRKTKMVFGATTDGKRMVVWVDQDFPDAWKKNPMRARLQGIADAGIDVIVVLGDQRFMITSNPETLEKLQ